MTVMRNMYRTEELIHKKKSNKNDMVVKCFFMGLFMFINDLGNNVFMCFNPCGAEHF